MMCKSHMENNGASLLTKVKASPVAPARPVRPTPLMGRESGPIQRKALGKPWENGGFTKKHWDFMGLMADL